MPHRAMAHVSYEDASPEVKEIYDDTMRVLGLPFVLAWFTCQGGNLRLLAGNWTKVRDTLFTGDVPILLKQLIIYNISRIRGCKYCTFIHGTTADMLGVELCDEDGFRATADLDSPHIPSSYKAAVRIVTRCALDPASTTDQDFEDLRDEGFSDAELQELFAQADLANMINAIADICSVEIDAELLAMSS